jgi:hypothetical protein
VAAEQKIGGSRQYKTVAYFERSSAPMTVERRGTGCETFSLARG